MKEFNVLSVYLQDLFVQCLFLYKPLIMNYKYDRHVLSVAAVGEASGSVPDMISIFFYFCMPTLDRMEVWDFLRVPVYTLMLVGVERMLAWDSRNLIFRFSSIPTSYVMFRKPLCCRPPSPVKIK